MRSNSPYTYGSFPNLPQQLIQPRIAKADRQFQTWCIIVSIALCAFSFFLLGSPRRTELNLSQRNLQVLGALKHSSVLAAEGPQKGYDPQKGSMIPNVVGCMQTNCMGVMQDAWKGGDSGSQGIMKCMNTFTGGDQQSCLQEAPKTDADKKLANGILNCGMCNSCYAGEKPDNCDSFKNSNWNNNIPTNYIPEAYRGFMGGKPPAGNNAAGFDYSQYMGGKGKGDANGAADYSQYMNEYMGGKNGYSQYMDKYMSGGKGSGSSAGGFDYSQYMQGAGGSSAGTMLVAEASADKASAPAPAEKSAAAPVEKAEAAPVQKTEAAPAEKKDETTNDRFDYSQYMKYMDNKGGNYEDQYKKYYSQYLNGGGGGGGGGKDSDQDMVKKMIENNATSAEIGDAFKQKYAGDYIKKYGGDAAKSDAGDSSKTDKGDATKTTADSSKKAASEDSKKPSDDGKSSDTSAEKSAPAPSTASKAETPKPVEKAEAAPSSTAASAKTEQSTAGKQ